MFVFALFGDHRAFALFLFTLRRRLIPAYLGSVSGLSHLTPNTTRRGREKEKRKETARLSLQRFVPGCAGATQLNATPPHQFHQRHSRPPAGWPYLHRTSSPQQQTGLGRTTPHHDHDHKLKQPSDERRERQR
jgi:hypothetical protein